MLDELVAEGVTYRNFFPHLADDRRTRELVARVARLLADPERGYAILDVGSPVDADPVLADRARLLLVILGMHFGQTVTKNHLSDSPFFSVFLRREGKGGKYIGSALSNNRPGIHTDGSALHDVRVDFMALLCIRPAKSGGHSIVVNALSVFSQLSPEVQSFLLQFPFARQNPYEPDNLTPVRRTVYYRVRTSFYSGLGIQYHRTRIEGGHRFVGEPLDPKAVHTLDALDSELYAPSNGQRFLLRSGTILLANNHVVCHDRTEFEDTLEAPRLLERYWSGEYLESPRCT